MIVRFCAAPASIRDTVEGHLFRAAQQSFEDCDCDFESPRKQLDWEAETTGRFAGARVPTWPADIWSLVSFNRLHVEPGRNPAQGRYVMKVVGDCAWDGEHGIAAVFSGTGTFIGLS